MQTISSWNSSGIIQKIITNILIIIETVILNTINAKTIEFCFWNKTDSHQTPGKSIHNLLTLNPFTTLCIVSSLSQTTCVYSYIRLSLPTWEETRNAFQTRNEYCTMVVLRLYSWNNECCKGILCPKRTNTRCKASIKSIKLLVHLLKLCIHKVIVKRLVIGKIDNMILYSWELTDRTGWNDVLLFYLNLC